MANKSKIQVRVSLFIFVPYSIENIRERYRLEQEKPQRVPNKRIVTVDQVKDVCRDRSINNE